jgi:adhesin/invasin
MRSAWSTWLVGILAFGTACFAAGVPASITPVNGATPVTPQSTPVGTQFPQTLTFVVKDAANNPLPGISVTLSAPSTGPSGFFFGGSHSITVTTASDGFAIPTFTANNLPGSYTVFASTFGANFQVISTSFFLTNTGPPAIITPSPGTTPQSTAVNQFFQPLKVLVTDAVNNHLAGVSVTFVAPSSGPSGFMLGGTTFTNTTDASGNVFVAFQANSIVGGPYVVTATAGSLSTSFSLTNVAPPASITPLPGTTPQTTRFGTNFPQPLGVKAADASNNPVPGVVVTFTAPSSGPSGFFVGGGASITATTDSSGNATVPFSANITVGGLTK